MSPPLSEEVAVRIGLAERQLPGIGMQALVDMLIRAVGLPITASKLARLRYRRLCKAAEGRLDVIPEARVRQVLALLKGEGVEYEAEPLPPVEHYREGDMPGSVRIACASDHGDKVDGGFSTCARFLVYQVSPVDVRLIDVRPVQVEGNAEDRLKQRVSLIADCHVLYTTSIGGPANASVVRAGVHTLKLLVPEPAPGVLENFRQVLEHSTPPWLFNAMQQSEQQTDSKYAGRQLEHSS